MHNSCSVLSAHTKSSRNAARRNVVGFLGHALKQELHKSLPQYIYIYIYIYQGFHSNHAQTARFNIPTLLYICIIINIY